MRCSAICIQRDWIAVVWTAVGILGDFQILPTRRLGTLNQQEVMANHLLIWELNKVAISWTTSQWNFPLSKVFQQSLNNFTTKQQGRDSERMHEKQLKLMISRVNIVFVIIIKRATWEKFCYGFRNHCFPYQPGNRGWNTAIFPATQWVYNWARIRMRVPLAQSPLLICSGLAASGK